MENRLDRLGRYMNWKQHGIYIYTRNATKQACLESGKTGPS